MINHATLNYHVTNFNTTTRSLNGSADGQIKTLNLSSDPYLDQTRSLIFFLIWPCHVTKAVLPIISHGSNLTLRYVGVVYKISYRRARAWPSARESKGISHTNVGADSESALIKYVDLT